MLESIPDIPSRAGGPGFWQKPFGPAQAACTVGGLATTGFALQLALGGRGVPAPVAPWSILLLAAFIAVILAGGRASRSGGLFLALSEVPVTLACFTAIGLMGAVAGTVPQRPPAEPGLAAKLGAHAVTTSWPFVLTLLLLLLNLGVALVRRLFPWRPGSARFALGHLGLWIALAAGTFGSGDIERVRLEVREGAAVVHGTDTTGAVREMPFGLRLLDFRLEEYPPAVTFLDTESGAMLWQKGDPRMEAVPGASGIWKHLRIEIESVIPRAIALPSGEYATGSNPDAPSAAILRVTDTVSGKTDRGAVVGGAVETLPKSLVVGKIAVTLAKPRPKNFLSEVILFTPDGASRPATVEVNAPASVVGWRVYQLGYDEKRGPGSDLATFEAVRDPWLPAVYAGVFLLIAGAFGMIFGGSRALFSEKEISQ